MQDIDLTVSNGLLLGLLLPVLCYLAFLAYRTVRRGVGGWLLGLRIASLALLTALLMAPILALTYQTQRLPLVAVLVDDSESMQLADGDTVRKDVAQRLLSLPALDALADRARVAQFQFADGLSPLTDPKALRWDGRATDIAGALDALREKTAGEGLSDVVLISDGGQNLGGQPERAAADLGVPILSVGVGSPVPPKDVAVVSAVMDALGYVGREMPLEVRVRAGGLDGVQELVTVRVGNNEVASKPIFLHDGEQTLVFQIHPDHAGRQAYRVSIAPQPGERTEANNHLVVPTEILESRVRILLIAGSPSADLSHLKRILSADSNMEVEALVQTGNGGWSRAVQTALRDLAQRDVVILLDVPHAALAGEPERQIANFVRSGGALLAIGGPTSFGDTYAVSELSDVLPLVFLRAPNTYRGEAFAPDIPEKAYAHAIMRVSDDPLADREAWHALPPLLAYNRTAGAVDGADVLFQHPRERIGGRPMPLASVMRVGRGKSMAVAFRTFWRFGLMMWGNGETDAVAQAFWQNAVRWLVARDDVSKVQITTDKPTYRSGEPVAVRAQIFNAAFQPVRGAQVRAVVADSGETRDVPLRELGDGRYEGTLGAFAQGDYAVEVQAREPGGSTEAGKGHFTVGRYSLEYETVRMNAERMAAIAERSGGRFLTPDALPDALNDLVLSPEPVVVNYKNRLWGQRWPLVLLVCLLGAEWVIRRRRGMV